MTNRGLNKLMEECGEVVQIAAKLSAYPNGDHPDGAGNLYTRLEDELADIQAAAEFVIKKLSLLNDRIEERKAKKIKTFNMWDADSNS